MREAGTDGERGVGDPARDDNVRARAQCVGNRVGAEVGIRGDETIRDGGKALAGFEVGESSGTGFRPVIRSTLRLEAAATF